MGTLEEITPVIERKLEVMGLELYDLKYHRAGRHSVLRVYIDTPDGVTIDDCERASRELSVVLDVEGFSKAPYTLEVSSPGVDRPLRYERDFRRAAGRDVAVELFEPVTERKRLEGTVRSCEGGIVILETRRGEVPVHLDNIKSGKMQVRFR
jgi:ribosome maturation factor RimP